MEPTTQQRPKWLQDIMDVVGQYDLTDQDIAGIGQYLLTSGVEDQVAQRQYQSDYLDFLTKQLGVNEQQLAQAQREMDFQQGPYWEFYTGPYFDFQKQQAANQLQMSNNDVLRSRNSVEQSRFGAQQAEYGKQAAQLQLWQQLGYIPKSESLNPRSRYGY